MEKKKILPYIRKYWEKENIQFWIGAAFGFVKGVFVASVIWSIYG